MRRPTMRGTVLYGPRDIRFEDRETPRIEEPTDAIIRIAATCVCGSDLWPYRGLQPLNGPTPMGHEYCGWPSSSRADHPPGGSPLRAGGQMEASRMPTRPTRDRYSGLVREVISSRSRVRAGTSGRVSEPRIGARLPPRGPNSRVGRGSFPPRPPT